MKMMRKNRSKLQLLAGREPLPVEPLHRGSRVAIVSPASAARVQLVERGCEQLRSFGYEPVLMPHALSSGPLYFAGTAEQRVRDLHAAFADPTVDAVLCTRGGWGAAELLPLLSADLIRRNPKLFIGYSDQTSLQSWLWNECGLPTVYGPMLAADWAKDDGVDERSWRAAVEADGAQMLGSGDGMRTLRRGKAEGVLLGGCLALLEAGLGTAFALHIDQPCILFLEDIGVKPYQWDRMLQHLFYAGMMERVVGAVFGDMSANVEARELESLEAACLHGLKDFPGPVAIGLRCGHVPGRNLSLRLGCRAELVCGVKTKLLCAGV